MNDQEYMKRSLELHLFFDRIMKEHSFFLEASFMEKDQELKSVANDFQKLFSDFLEEIILLANENISKDFIDSNEFVTKYTMKTEEISSKLSGIPINFDITEKELNLKSGKIDDNVQILNKLSSINRRTLLIVSNLIYFKEDILNQVLTCELYTTNYPLLITHIKNEAKLYYELLSKVERREPFTDEYMNQQELFWNRIMMEHTEFIRGLLDPSEEKLIEIANNFTLEYKKLLDKYTNNSKIYIDDSLNEVIKLKDFKIAAAEGIINCQIKSIIIPLLTDHVLREANHFIHILRNAKNTNR